MTPYLYQLIYISVKPELDLPPNPYLKGTVGLPVLDTARHRREAARRLFENAAGNAVVHVPVRSAENVPRVP
jgi:hypothetical protein